MWFVRRAKMVSAGRLLHGVVSLCDCLSSRWLVVVIVVASGCKQEKWGCCELDVPPTEPASAPDAACRCNAGVIGMGMC